MVISERKFISEVLNDLSGGKLRYAILSGPSFAEEMIKSHPTCVVVASKHTDDAKYIQERLNNIFFRVYTQTDVIGVEIAGALVRVGRTLALCLYDGAIFLNCGRQIGFHLPCH